MALTSLYIMYIKAGHQPIAYPCQALSSPSRSTPSVWFELTRIGMEHGSVCVDDPMDRLQFFDNAQLYPHLPLHFQLDPFEWRAYR